MPPDVISKLWMKACGHHVFLLYSNNIVVTISKGGKNFDTGGEYSRYPRCSNKHTMKFIRVLVWRWHMFGVKGWFLQL